MAWDAIFATTWSRLLAPNDLTRFEPMTSFFMPYSKGYLDNVELNTWMLIFWINYLGLLAHEQVIWIPLEHTNIEAIVASYEL